MKNINENIENIIKKIKDKIKKNPKYLHPCNKEFQEDIKRYRFENGNRFIYWMRQNGILRTVTDIERDSRDKIAKGLGFNNRNHRRLEMRQIWAQNLGYKDDPERQRSDRYDKGTSNPSSKNKDCSLNFGIDIGEKTFNNILLEVFEYVRHDKEEGCLDGGIDFFCKDPSQEFIDKYPQFKLQRGIEYKIQLKMRCLYNGDALNFNIQYNDRVDFFILSGWNNRIDLDHLYTWLIHKDEIIRGRKLWRRDSLQILNRPKYLLEFKRFELTDKIEKLKDICKKLKEDNV